VISATPVHPGSRVSLIGAPTECIQGVRSGNPYMVLENLICVGACNADCLRSIYVFRREIWLDRVGRPDDQ
jgi:hypothetical protein